MKILFFLFPMLLNAQSLLLYDIQREYNKNKNLTFIYTELFDNGANTFESGTYHWTKYGINTLANVSNELEITFVDNSAGAYVAFSNASDLTSDLDINSVYKFNGQFRSNSGTPSIRIYYGTGYTIYSALTTLMTYYPYVYKPTSATNSFVYFASMTAGMKIYADNLSIKKLIPPTNFATTIADASNYIIEATGGGCEFHEATGTTFIEMSDTLKAGYYTVKTLQDWTQGKLYIYNEVTTYYLPQADGYYSVKVYADGTHPLSIQCDNNTISNLKLLSVKK